MKRLIILGAGTGGTIMANLLRRRLARADWAITVVDRDNEHYYQPGFLFIPFGFYTQEGHRQAPLEVPAARRRVHRRRSGPDRPGRERGRFPGRERPRLRLSSSSPRGPRSCRPRRPACSTAGATRSSTSTRPTAPRPWPRSSRPFPAAVSSSTSTRRPSSARSRLSSSRSSATGACGGITGARTSIIVYVTPLDGAFTKPVASKALGALLDEKRVQMVTDFNAERIDAAGRKIIGYDGREVPYDLLVTVPTNMGSEMIERSGMGDEFRFLPTDPNTLRSKKYENVFAIGDATDVPTSKAGSVAHFQAEILAGNVVRAIEGRPLEPAFDGHSNCFVESGRRQGHPDRFQLRRRAAPRALPLPRRRPDAAAQAEPHQSLGQARVPVDLLAHPPAGAPDPVRPVPHEDGRQEAAGGRRSRARAGEIDIAERLRPRPR